MPTKPIRLTPEHAERYAPLRRRMLDTAPWAFDASPDDEEALDPARIAAMLGERHGATFAFEAPDQPTRDEPDLVATASITRAKLAKYAHRARLWGVYVHPPYRGQGLGEAVTVAAIEAARGWTGVEFIDLGVSDNSPEALALYERLGFRAWGREPQATDHEGRRYDEIHMTLRL